MASEESQIYRLQGFTRLIILPTSLHAPLVKKACFSYLFIYLLHIFLVTAYARQRFSRCDTLQASGIEEPLHRVSTCC
jgi:hypothetical protein